MQSRKKHGQAGSQTTLQSPNGSMRTDPSGPLDKVRSALVHRQVPGSLAPVIIHCPENTAARAAVHSVFSDLCHPLAKTNPVFCFSGFPQWSFLDAQDVFAKSLGTFVMSTGSLSRPSSRFKPLSQNQWFSAGDDFVRTLSYPYPRTFGNGWRCCLSDAAGGCAPYWCLVARGQGCYQICYNQRTGPQRITDPNVTSAKVEKPWSE